MLQQSIFKNMVMNKSLLIRPSPMSHSVLFNPSPLTFVPAFEISRFKRKHGLYSYKLGRNKNHKNPHSIPLKNKMFFKSQGY